MYKVLEADSPISAEQLDAAINDGWMLIQILPWKGKLLFYFIATSPELEG